MDAVLFDKDGTLFDFEATWGAWAAKAMRELAEGDEALAVRLGQSIGYDLAACQFSPDSPAIAGTIDEVAALLLVDLPAWDGTTLIKKLDALAAVAPQVEVTPLAPLLDALQSAGLKLGVATNDSETAAYAHLGQACVTDRFDFIAGYDSGFGSKPGPGPLLAFAETAGVLPERVAMVGDSTHDLLASQAAGMMAVGVLTGPATRADLAPYADVVLASISELPAWLDI